MEMQIFSAKDLLDVKTFNPNELKVRIALD